MASENVFGSDELTPELVRSATFPEQDGRYDAAEVRAFLDRIASSLDVFLSQDAPAALRAEFARNAQIAQQVLDAGQTASAQLRAQAGEDAHRILQETREATERLRSEVEDEIRRSREQVEGMRAQFIQDLRDLYDRIGASLYRFERAAEESHVAPISEPSRAPESTPQAAPVPAQQLAPAQQPAPPQQPAPAQQSEPEAAPVAPPVPEPPPVVAPPTAAEVPGGPDMPPADQVDVPELPEGAKPPAWQQLPPEAWSGAVGDDPGGAEPPAEPAAAPASDPFSVQEDEPLAPGEPLVDLREFSGEPAATPPANEPGGSWLDAADPAGEPAAPRADVAPAGDLGGSWLGDEPADVVGPSDPMRARDDALAEALIAAAPIGDEGAPAGSDSPPPPADPGPVGADANASADAVAVRQLILDSLAAGQPREAVEAYLRDQMGFMEPGALVDAALGTAGQA